MKRRLSNALCDSRFIDPKKWMSATKLRNALVNNHYADLVVEGSLRGKTKLGAPVIRKKNIDNFLFSQGILFEKNIIDSIKAKFKPSQIVTIGEANPYSIADYEKTKSLIEKRTPIIFGGVLHNNRDCTFGLPDIIIRGDYLKKLFDAIPDSADPYGYAIIDVKFTTMDLKNDKFTLKNGLNFTPYKSQVLVYSRALDIVTGEKSSQGYILGRGWKNRDEKISNPFSRPGVVNYTPDVSEATDRAIEWMNYVKAMCPVTLAGFTKAPYTTVIPRKEIYPNMHYNLDPAWVWDAKNSFANAIGDISQMYMCGKIIKERAIAKGITSWRDPQFIDVIKGHKYFNNIKNIIEINRNCDPTIIMNYEKVTLPEKALFLDFEVLADIIHDNSFSSQIIFMIGIGYEKNGEFIYKEFTTDKTSHDEESRICKDFITFLETENLKDYTLVHWSHAESWQWAKARKRLSHDYNLKLFDLCEEFKKHAVSIRGAFNYSLKSIAKAMYSHGIIDTVWPETGPANGIAAIEFLGKGGDMETIKKYNKVDVQVLYQIGGGARPQNPPAGL